MTPLSGRQEPPSKVLSPLKEALTPSLALWWSWRGEKQRGRAALGRFGVTIPQVALQKESQASSVLRPLYP